MCRPSQLTQASSGKSLPDGILLWEISFQGVLANIFCWWCHMPNAFYVNYARTVTWHVPGNDRFVWNTWQGGGSRRTPPGVVDQETRAGVREEVSSTRGCRWCRPHHIWSGKYVETIHSVHRQRQPVRSRRQILAGKALAGAGCSVQIRPLVTLTTWHFFSTCPPPRSLAGSHHLLCSALATSCHSLPPSAVHPCLFDIFLNAISSSLFRSVSPSATLFCLPCLSLYLITNSFPFPKSQLMLSYLALHHTLSTSIEYQF